MSINFYLEKRPNKAGENPIRAQVSIRSSVLISTIGYSVNPDVWNGEQVDERLVAAWYKKLKKSDKDAVKVGRGQRKPYVNSKGVTDVTINQELIRIKAHFADYEEGLDHKPSKEELKNQLLIALKKMPEKTTATTGKAPKQKMAASLFDNFDEFTREQGLANQWAYATRQTWKTFRNHLERFNKRLKYADLTESGINRYVAFLRNTEGLEEKTVLKHYSQLKWFVNWAIRKGYCTNEAINRHRPKFKVVKKPVIFLTKEELLKLYNYQIPANGTKVKLFDMQGMEYEKKVEEAGALAKTRDLFCFCAFTSLRYSDMAKVKRIDIEGKQLYVTTQKTNDRLPIDLNSFALEILDKYKDEKFPEGLALPVISNQKMNHYLKDLGELCGFNNPITRVCYRGGERVEETFPKYALIGTHAGRRTFICFALSSGIPPQVVMKWTGHSDYKAMKPYIDIAEKTKANAMNLFEMELKK